MTATIALHTAILVRDLARAEAFYGDILQLPKVDRVLRFPGVWYQIGSFQLHLIVSEMVPQTVVTPSKWGRNPHIALGVADLPAVQTRLEAAGYAVQPSASGRAALFTQDPDGNVVELNQL